MSKHVYLVAEDQLGLAVGRRLIREVPALEIFRERDYQGFGNLQNDALRFSNMARNGVPVLLFTDLDQTICPKSLIDKWLGNGTRSAPEFLLRVCVREVEAWLLADPRPLADLFHLSPNAFPRDPELIPDPKRELLRLAQHAPARVRQQLLPKVGSKASIGIGYNTVLTDLILNQWDPNAAATRAKSLARAKQRVNELAQRYAAAP